MSAADEVTGRRPLECSTCEFDDVTKASVHCGWVPQDEWHSEPPTYPPIAGYDGDVCPGYLMTMPMIREAEVACAAFRNGQLREFFPGLEQTALSAAMEVHGAYNRYEAERMAESSRKH